jgi:hypothetical protein
MPKPFTTSEQAAALGDLAWRARRLAETFALYADKARLLRYAAELEQLAAQREPAFAINWGVSHPSSTKRGRTSSPDNVGR